MTTSTLRNRQNGNHISTVESVLGSLLPNHFEQIFSDGFWGEDVKLFSGNVPVNIRETEKEYQIDLVAPGCRKEDFKISISEKLLTVSFSPEQTDSGNDKVIWRRNEFMPQKFRRDFTVDDSVDVNNITATYENGILRISLAKNPPQEKFGKRIEIR